jgi:hypothetical protein
MHSLVASAQIFLMVVHFLQLLLFVLLQYIHFLFIFSGLLLQPLDFRIFGLLDLLVYKFINIVVQSVEGSKARLQS